MIAKAEPVLGKSGRPSRIITNGEISAVIGSKKNAPCSAPCSAIVLQTKLYNRHCIKIPHNRIHTVLNDHSLASNLPKNKGEGNGSYRKEGKKERKKMEHELWHTD